VDKNRPVELLDALKRSAYTTNGGCLHEGTLTTQNLGLSKKKT